MSEEAKPEAKSNGVTQQTILAEQPVPHFRLTEERNKRERLTQQNGELAQEFERLKGQYDAQQKELNGMRSQHQQEMYLVEQGFKAPSVRRFFRREYADSVAELPNDNRPTFEAWLSANQDDPLYSVHFNRLTQSTEPVMEAPQDAEPTGNEQLIDALRAALVGNPDAGASQPRDHKNKEWTADEIRKLRAKNKPQGSSRGKLPNGELEQILSDWRSKGIIK